MSATAIVLREDLSLTLGDLADRVGGGTDVESVDVDLSRVKVQNATPSSAVIALGDKEVPATPRGFETLAGALQVHAPTLRRLGERGGMVAQAELLNLALRYTADGVVRASYVDGDHGGLSDLADPFVERVRPAQLVDVAGKVLGDMESPVQRLVDSDGMLSFDVHVPLDGEHVYGDPASLVDAPEDLLGYSWVTKKAITEGTKVGDVTAAGMRFSLDSKHGRAPSAQPWAMRLACTNGMEMTTSLTKIDGRGLTVDEVLWDLEMKSNEAFALLERQVAAFYEMRNTPVPNPERRLRAIARERGIPDRSLMRMLNVAPEVLGDDSSEFDLVNVITNMANTVTNDGGRLLLERAGGHLVTDHSVRCHTCNHSLVNG